MQWNMKVLKLFEVIGWSCDYVIKIKKRQPLQSRATNWIGFQVRKTEVKVTDMFAGGGIQMDGSMSKNEIVNIAFGKSDDVKSVSEH